ncbi:hypothetical protein PRBRB14_06370 [Hallella multisaccharivorax DSM 17128]|uniref:Outer membrane protein beta-barrel domain-containing protein n=1 Tax=Hallella multisaccharivorax DSM 17128 TaxID=688246 RepID=F8N6N0_9BACT|nr:porin family protein [Hallella multisaccharivorax]EGN56245.1 hypothetical protein Premu_0784 [Hallella multisaccharivorax DSM 17128]GJG29758.1 hypothetical protein PRBRB14_06370 [Hallella multisaccharivorax DSM 17128]
MKKTFIFLLALISTLTASAQYYPNGRPIPPRHRYAYQHDRHDAYTPFNDTYVGFRLGMTTATVHSDAAILDGSDPRTGLDIGIVAGTRLTYKVPLYFESGLSYTEKGGKGNYKGSKFTYRLEYLELPLVVKYKYALTPDIALEPFAGGYLALGVGGKIKDFGEREAYSSFSGDERASFRRFDGGLRLGCGASFNALYLGLSYDVGLANVGHYDFEDTRTGSLNLNIGVTF